MPCPLLLPSPNPNPKNGAACSVDPRRGDPLHIHQLRLRLAAAALPQDQRQVLHLGEDPLEGEKAGSRQRPPRLWLDGISDDDPPSCCRSWPLIAPPRVRRRPASCWLPAGEFDSRGVDFRPADRSLRGRTLIVSSEIRRWGLARHFHYVPEILASFFWTAPALFSHVSPSPILPFSPHGRRRRPPSSHLSHPPSQRLQCLPYFYVVYLTILLADRAKRDDDRCSTK